ncbi:diflavin flavoprotein [Geitlerinema sp. PCC 9228]|uniref:diflavin flavoprotein n=1 Tax=Geitlerinema sp. PCC 9228 TaxID=111611 RepID=UPI0008F9CE00|nr:diflavin flavoprotein [Geitlerinema sp. PCC 9228]
MNTVTTSNQVQTAKPKDVQIMAIAANTWVWRSRTWDRLKFEVEYSLQKGTTANSYYIQGEKTALLDPPGKSFTQIYLAEITQRVDLKQLDYLILGHVNPNRAATIGPLLDRAPNATIVTSNPGKMLLQQAFPERQLQVRTIRNEETLDLGKGHQLQLIPTPTPRYPDELLTYDRATGILFSDKFFGAHVCGDQIFDEGWNTYKGDRRFYFDCIHIGGARQVESALEKIAKFPITFYAPAHGPMVRDGLQELTQSYRNWIQKKVDRGSSVVLLYASAYGNTAEITHAMAKGLAKGGAQVHLINCEFAETSEIENAIAQCSGFIIGTPTLGGHAPTQIQTALGIVLATASKNKLAGVFGSYGWSGEAIDYVENKLKDAGFQLAFDPLRVKFKPTDSTLQYSSELGTDFAQTLKKSQKQRSPRLQKGTLADRTSQAVGRIVGSLCVVTAKRGEMSSAMLASWVSQATFTPPGITVAVAKERAIEALMYEGDKFVLNILAEGKQVRRHFMKKFAPSEDRLSGLNIDTANNGCAVIVDALAYLECTVEQRMECGDHWLVYAVVDAGEVLDSEGITAVHTRKSGNHY